MGVEGQRSVPAGSLEPGWPPSRRRRQQDPTQLQAPLRPLPPALTTTAPLDRKSTSLGKKGLPSCRQSAHKEQATVVSVASAVGRHEQAFVSRRHRHAWAEGTSTQQRQQHQAGLTHVLGIVLAGQVPGRHQHLHREGWVGSGLGWRRGERLPGAAGLATGHPTVSHSRHYSSVAAPPVGSYRSAPTLMPTSL